MRARERNSFSIGLRHVEEDLASAHRGDQRAEHMLCAGAIVGNERTDLEPDAARPDHAPGGKAPVATERG